MVFILKQYGNMTINTIKISDKNTGLFTVYPNPTEGVVNLIFQSYSDNISLKIINQEGKTVLKKGNTNSNALNKIDVHHLPKGVYALHITHGTHSELQYFILN